MSKYPEIPVIIIKHDTNALSPRPHIAACLVNPQMRASGETEEEAIKQLKQNVIGQYGGLKEPGKKREFQIKYTTISFDEELVEEIMDV